MSHMDLDDDGFDDLEFNPDDLQLLDKTEQYYSSQMNIDNMTTSASFIPPSSNVNMSSQINMKDDKSSNEELRQELLRLQNDNKRLINELRIAKESARLKDHDLLQLKRKQTTESITTQPKRAFPGAPFPQVRTKYKRTTNSTFVREESMPLASRSPTPAIQTQVQTTDMDTRSQSVLLDSIVKPETVTIEPPQEKPQVQLEPVTRVKLKSRPTVKKIPKQSDAYNELLMILFADVFRKWNRSQDKDFKSCLTPDKIRYFCGQFVKSFVLDKGVCSEDTIQQLNMIAAEITEIIIRSTDVESTIRLLLIQFNASLNICIENKLYDMIHTIATLINELAAYYDVVKGQFYKEFLLDRKHSTIHKLVNCFSLYDFKAKQPKASQIMVDYPNIASINYSQSKQIAEKYGTFPSIVAEAVHAKTKSPPGAQQTVTAILEILNRVGKHFEKPVFIFLLEDEGFLSLLSPDVPVDLLNKTYSLLQTNFTSKNWTQHYDYNIISKENYSCKAVVRLTDLINMPQRSLTFKNWYLIRRKMLSILKDLCGVQLPEFISTWIHRKTYTRIIDLMISLCGFSPIGKRTEEIKDHELLVKEGFLTIYTIMKTDCSSLFDENSEYTTSKLQDLVNYYLEKVTHEQHRARNVLLCIERVIDSLMES